VASFAGSGCSRRDATMSRLAYSVNISNVPFSVTVVRPPFSVPQEKIEETIAGLPVLG
jgi:hypothetical protein